MANQLSDKESRFLNQYAQLSNPSSAQQSTYKLLSEKQSKIDRYNRHLEVMRKAENGEALTQAEMGNKSIYDAKSKEIQEAVRNAAMSGTPLADPMNSYQSKLYYDTQMKMQEADYNSPLNVQKRNQALGDESMKQIMEYLTKSAGGYMESQKALLGQARDQQIAELQANLEKAVQDGEMSVREAESMFAQQSEAINKQAYLDSQSTGLMAQDMGIQNSMQFAALRQGDQIHANNNRNNAMTERDTRIHGVRERLKALSADTARGVTQANANYNYGLANAQGQSDMNLNQQIAGLMQQDMAMDREQGFQLDMAGLNQKYTQDNMKMQQKMTLEQFAVQHGYDLDKMSVEQKYQLEQMAKQQGYTIDNMERQQKMTLEQFAVQHGYDLEKMSEQQKNDLAKMATQQGYDLEMADHQSALNIEEMTAQIKAQQEAELKEYDLAVQRELAKYQPGTKEYEIRKGQLASEREAMIAEMATATQYEVVSQQILNGQTTKPTKPKKDWWEPQSKHDKDMKEYEEKMKAYERYLDFQNDPMSAFPNLGSLSSKYESNGNPGSIGNNAGDKGGKSYGTYQLSTNSGNAQRFADSYGGPLKGLKAGTAAFDKAWKAEAAKNPIKFQTAQHTYIAKTHFQPAVDAFQKVTGIVAGGLPKAIQDVLWSVGVQHGKAGAKSVFEKAGIKKGDSPATIIKKIYKVRPSFFGGSSASIQKSVANRFKQEEQDALRMLG